MSHTELLQGLKAESELMQALLVQLRAQQQALVGGGSQAIQSLSHQAEDLISRLQLATKLRTEAQQGFESLDAAAESAPDLRSRTQFKALLVQLRQGAAELQQLQQRNQALIVQGLGWVDATLSAFVDLHTQGQPAVYGASGTEAQAWQSERSMCDFNA